MKHLIPCLIACCLMSSSFAQDDTEVSASEPPQLEPVFSDDFSTDTRGDYEITGDVAWEPGKLTLRKRASIKREIEGGTHARVRLTIDGTDKSSSGEITIQLGLAGARDVVVKITRDVESADRELTVSMWNLDPEKRLRSVSLPDQDLSEVTVEYRWGLIRVLLPDNIILAGHVDHINALDWRESDGQLASLQIRTTGGLSGLTSVKVDSATRRPAFTAEQQQELAFIQKLISAVLKAYSRGDYSVAAKINAQLLEKRRTLLGHSHPDVGQSLNDQALLEHKAGQSDSVVAYYQGALKNFAGNIGAAHPDYANSLYSLAVSYASNGDYARAKPMHRQALDIRKSVLGEQHPEYARSLNSLAVLHARMEDFARAEPLYKQALEVWRSVFGEQHPEYANSLNNLAALYSDIGEDAHAELLYKQALEIRKSVLGEQHPDYADSLNNLAALYTRRWDFARAELLFKQALEIKRSVFGEQHPVYATGLHNLAQMYIRMGDYARAEPLYKRALEIRKSVLGEQHPDYAISLNELAAQSRLMGRLASAEALFKQALDIEKSVLGQQHPDYATSLNNLAEVYHSMGDFARAEPMLKQALEIKKSVLGKQHPDYADGLNSVAVLYHSMGDYDRAVPLFEQAIELQRLTLGEQDPVYANSLQNLAALYSVMGDYGRAEPLYFQALEINKSVLGERHPGYAEVLDNLAVMYNVLRDYTRAEALSTQAMQIRKSVLGDRHPAYARSLYNHASLYKSMGDYARAVPLSKQALEIRKSILGAQHPDYASGLNNLAELYLALGDSDRAGPVYRQAADIQRLILISNATVQSARQQNRNQNGNRYFLDNRLTNAIAMTTPDLVTIVGDLWQWKGAVTTRQQAYRQVAANPQLAPLFADLQSVSRQLSALTGKSPVPPAKTASDAARTAFEQKHKFWKDRFATLSRQREDLEQQIAAGSEEFRRIREPLTVAEIRQWLPAETAFVDFLEYRHGTPNTEQKGKIDYERRYIAFVVRPDQEPAMIGLGSAASLAEAVTALRRPFLAEQNTSENRGLADKAARQIRRDLWLPIEKHLDGVDTVIISPDTALGTLPFAALPGKKDGSHLLEDYRIAMLPMANLLPKMIEQKPTESENGLLLVGNVDYTHQFDQQSKGSTERLLFADASTQWEASQLRSGNTHQFASLPGFRKELDLVEKLFQSQFADLPSTTLSGGDATEANFLQQAAQARVLHVITHGYFADPSVKSISQTEIQHDGPMSDNKGPDPFIGTYLPGLLSGLAMAGANNPSTDAEDPRDGILRASELEASSLQGVDLVVLSACETGLGKVAGGEGLTGLQRAFHMAGARSVIASLWQVDDAATTELMRLFYTNLWDKKMSKIDALREAQLTMLSRFDVKTGKVRGLGGNEGEFDPNRPAPKSTKSQRLDPRYWAAFQLSGDWR